MIESTANEYDDALALLDTMFVAIYTGEAADFEKLQKALPPAKKAGPSWWTRLTAKLSNGGWFAVLVLGASIVLFVVWWLVDLALGKPFDLAQTILVAGAFAAVIGAIAWCIQQFLPKPGN